MAENELVVQVREGTGKGVARKLRAAGHIPGVCYGRSSPSIGIAVNPKALDRLLAESTAGMNTLIDLRVEGSGAYDGKSMLVKELQRDPVTGSMLHVDLYAVDLRYVVDAGTVSDAGCAPRWPLRLWCCCASDRSGRPFRGPRGLCIYETGGH